MFGRNKGPFGNWFGGFPGARFERGDLKLVILDLLKDNPRHGYDIIQQLEKKFHGFYSPSPGSVYPILQLLEDQDLVTSSQKTGKKVYTITSQGEKFLQDHTDEVADVQSRANPPWKMHGGQMQQIREEIGQTARLIFCNAAQGIFSNPKKMEKLHTAFEHFRQEIEVIISEDKKK